MNETERYFFDINGFLIIENVLSEADIELANAAIDHYQSDIRPRPENQSLAGGSAAFTGVRGRLELSRRLLELESHWCDVFRRLLDHPRLVGILDELLEPGFRLDHMPMLLAMEEGCEGFKLHGGGIPHDPSQSYMVSNGRIYTGLTVACWQLTDIAPGDGGFCCIPGSHKANFPCPDEIRSGVEGGDLLVQPKLPAGSLLVFTEALTHGTLPWAASHPRRSILYKYTPGFMNWAPAPDYPSSLLDELTPAQRELLAPAARAVRNPPSYD
ncbi:MAG: hypothetical protein DHS20C01_33020 [marine bacterium B5-7]|nr:MAG: hypothetical protein DHS20C01_33020 [marine bacterium B5-7]